MAILPEHPSLAQTLGRRPWPRSPRYLAGEDGTIVGPSGRIIQGGITKAGHRISNVRLADGRTLCTGQHVIICETFHGPRPEGKQVAHGDGNPLNNRPENLSWKTPVANRHDQLAHGTYGHKLTPAQVREIRDQPDVPRRELAERYGVSVGHIGFVLRGQTWQVVTPLKDDKQGPTRG